MLFSFTDGISISTFPVNKIVIAIFKNSKNLLILPNFLVLMVIIMVIEVQLVKGTYKSFTNVLGAENIKYSKRYKLNEVNAYETIQVVAPTVSAIAYILVTWLKAKQNRKIAIKKSENEIIQLHGYSVEEATKFLENAKSIEISESKQKEKT